MAKNTMFIALSMLALTAQATEREIAKCDTVDSLVELLVSSTNYWAVDAGKLNSIYEPVLEAALQLEIVVPREKHVPLPQVFTMFADGPLPSDVDMHGSNSWFRTKHRILYALYGSPVVREDTNCWLAIARARRSLAPLRGKRWYEYIDRVPGSTVEHPDGTATFEVPPEKRYLINGDSIVEIRADGTARVVVPDGPGVVCGVRLGRRRTMPAESLEGDIASYDGFLLRAIGSIPQTERFKSMGPDEKASIVSNIAATALLTEEELARTGLSPCVAPDDAVDPPSPSAAPGLL